MQKEAWCPQPEDRRASNPGRDQREPSVTAKIRGEGQHQPDESARDEEPDREQRLVGSRADMDAPDTRVEVLVELANGEPQKRNPMITVTLAARTLLDVVPNRPWTRFATDPLSLRCVVRRAAKAFWLPAARLKNATTTSAAGTTDSMKYADAAAAELRLASR